MARRFRRKHSSHPIADLNVTNLIDLGFMLLVIFMIATPLIQQEQKVAVDLPVESVKPQQTPDPKDRYETITVQADGGVLLDARRVSLGQLSAELARFAAEPKPPVIQLRCDAKASMQHVITVMDELQKQQVKRVGLMVKPAG